MLSPDILGTQELTSSALTDLEKRLPSYGWCGTGRLGGNQGEYAAIFYKKSLFSLSSQHTFWLSREPERQASRSWLTFFPRICTEACLFHRPSGRELLVFNTHLDHLSFPSRRQSLFLITRIIRERRQETHLPVIFMGDFNAKPHSKTLRVIDQTKEDAAHRLHSSYLVSSASGASTGRSYHGFYGGNHGEPIDYIFVSSEFCVREISVDRRQVGGVYPSDHYPVTALLSF